VVIPAVVDAATVAMWTGHLRHLQDRERSAGPIVTAPLATDPVLAGMAGDPRLVTVAASILEAEPVAFGCTYIVKEPRCGRAALWHQDGYPWRTRLGITEAVTLWVALDPAGEDSGGLRVIPGSHTLEAQPLRLSAGPASVFGAEIDPDLVDTARARQLTLAPGDMSAHHPNLIHGSLPNRSEHPRRALAVRYRPV
jgi:ectoine hydroxylase-related dioxygenase (phytanoyl-CoA dioxygenase family)